MLKPLAALAALTATTAMVVLAALTAATALLTLAAPSATASVLPANTGIRSTISVMHTYKGVDGVRLVVTANQR